MTSQLTPDEITHRRKRMWSELGNVTRNNATASFGGRVGTMRTVMTIRKPASTHRRTDDDLEPLPHMTRILERYDMQIAEIQYPRKDERRFILEHRDGLESDDSSDDVDVDTQPDRDADRDDSGEQQTLDAIVTDGGEQIEREPHGYERHDSEHTDSVDTTPALDEPIKVRFEGDSASKWETRTLEPMSADGHAIADYARTANSRFKTRIVIVTEGELEGCLETLEKHADFCGPFGASWGHPKKQDAACRAIREIRERAREQDVDRELIGDEL